MVTAPETFVDRRPAIDRRTLAIVGALALAAVLVNGDKLLQGPLAFERAHDGGDYLVTTLVACGSFWRAPASALWDPSIARGWPALYGSFAPQYLGCLAAAVMPSHDVWPIVQIVLLGTIAVGSFLFLRLGLGISHEASFAGTLLNVALFYWVHENDSQTSATLLVPLLGFLSLRGDTAARAIAFLGLAAIISLSVPVGTLVLMPTAHLALVFLLPKAERRRHLVAWLGFWTMYGLFYLPTMLGYLKLFASSNRALFSANTAAGQSFGALFMELLNNAVVVSPALILVVFMSSRTLRTTLATAAAVLALVAFAALNQFVLQHFTAGRQWLVSASTTYYRVYFLIPVLIFVWGSRVLADVAEARISRMLAARIFAVGLFAAIVGRALIAVRPAFYGQFNQYALWLGFGLTAVMLIAARRRDAAVALLLAVGFMAAPRHWYTQNFESPLQGNLFLERVPSAPPSPFRTVTVMRTCDASDIFPAQSAIGGRETLDGVDNLYDRSFAERWQFYVARGSNGCSARYAGWNTRIEVTPDDFAREPDRIMSWLWINGVDEVRSAVPLAHPDLILDDAAAFNIQWLGPTTRYRYRVRNPLTRVFAIPAAFASASPPLERESAQLRDMKARGAVTAILAEAYSGSRISFSGSFDPGSVIQASVNFHPDWTLYVDGVKAARGLVSGLFGMPAFFPQPGFHSYTLAFQPPSSEAFLTIGCMLLSLGALAFSR